MSTDNPQTPDAAAPAAPPKYTCFDVTVSEHVALVRMVRGKQHNSMNSAFWKELPLVLDEVEADENVRVMVLAADGPTFCSGLDLSLFRDTRNLSTDTAVQRERLRRLVLQLQAAINRIESCRVPVLAAIQGGCIGAGFDLICACDLRYGSKDAYFTIHEINLGMMADLGTLQRLPRLIPPTCATELALTGDKLDASRAKSLGLLVEVLDDGASLLAHVMSAARRIAARSPLAVLASRQAMRYARDHSVNDALEHAATWQAAIFDVADVTKAVVAQKSGQAAAEFHNVDTSSIEL